MLVHSHTQGSGTSRVSLFCKTGRDSVKRDDQDIFKWKHMAEDVQAYAWKTLARDTHLPCAKSGEAHPQPGEGRAVRSLYNHLASADDAPTQEVQLEVAARE